MSQSQDTRSYFESIPPGREGYVYLIHAEGTTRYKIGRSVNPIVRQQELQKQSPYPLKIVRSFWTLDAIADESLLHEHFLKWRVFGEWFDLGGSENRFGSPKVEMVLEEFEFSPVIHRLADQARDHLCQKIGLNSDLLYVDVDIWRLYGSSSSRQEISIVDFFVKETLFYLFTEKHPWPRSEDEICSFFSGCIKTFQFTVLKKRI